MMRRSNQSIKTAIFNSVYALGILLSTTFPVMSEVLPSGWYMRQLFQLAIQMRICKLAES